MKNFFLKLFNNAWIVYFLICVIAFTCGALINGLSYKAVISAITMYLLGYFDHYYFYSYKPNHDNKNIINEEKTSSNTSEMNFSTDVIDLNTCKKGDTLILRNGSKMTYLKRLTNAHLINYSDNFTSTRTDAGKFYGSNEDSEFDVVKIIHN